MRGWRPATGGLRRLVNAVPLRLDVEGGGRCGGVHNGVCGSAVVVEELVGIWILSL